MEQRYDCARDYRRLRVRSNDSIQRTLEPFRSQKVRFQRLASPGFVEGNSDHAICLSSKVIRPVCKSTVQDETLACLWGVEPGVRIKAAMADARGTLGDDRKLRPDGGEGSDDFEALVDD